jgi:hypothetical protein
MSYLFNHEDKEMHVAFCIDQETADKIIGRIIFETLKSNCIERDFEEIGEEPPATLMKKTSVLETVLKSITSKQEELFAAFFFLVWHEKTNYVWRKQLEVKEKLSSSVLMDKLKEGASEVFAHISQSVLQNKIDEFAKEKMAEFKGYNRIVKQVINSNYDFDLFSAIIDHDFDYVSDVVDKAVQDV